MEEKKKHKIIKDKKNKLSNDVDFALLNAFEFSQLNNDLCNDILNLKMKTKKNKKEKIKKKDIHLIKNKTLDDDIKLQPNINDVPNDKQYINTVNPLIKNEIIWYSNDLDTTELENKFKTKFNSLNEANNKDDMEDKVICKVKNLEIEPHDTIHYEIPQIIEINKSILECKKIDFNIFVCDTSCDPNFSSNKQSEISIYLNDMFIVSGGEKYIPGIVEIYSQSNILLKKIYSDVIKNINNLEIKVYKITDDPFLLNTSITIKIIDSKEIDAVFFNSHLEKVEKVEKVENKNSTNQTLCLTHELLYDGKESDIKIYPTNGYYKDIYVICENIINNIKSISLTNTDIILFKNIPIQFLDLHKNSITYNFDNNRLSGLKIESNNWLNIKLDKLNNDQKIKIYGNKYSLQN